MRREDFEAMYAIEESFWWYRGMRKITNTAGAFDRITGTARILDAGCGTGFNIRYLSERGANEVFGFDIAADAVEFNRRRGVTSICRASVTEIPFPTNTFAAVLSLDSISHVPIDLQMGSFAELLRVLKPRGTLFIRVPAYEWMRSSHDEGMGNTKRFTVTELRSQLEAAGFVVELCSYANCFLFPVALAVRSLKAIGLGRGSDVKPLPAGARWTNDLLEKVLSSEAGLLARGARFPFGLSVICRAVKPA